MNCLPPPNKLSPRDDGTLPLCIESKPFQPYYPMKQSVTQTSPQHSTGSIKCEPPLEMDSAQTPPTLKTDEEIEQLIGQIMKAQLTQYPNIRDHFKELPRHNAKISVSCYTGNSFQHTFKVKCMYLKFCVQFAAGQLACKCIALQDHMTSLKLINMICAFFLHELNYTLQTYLQSKSLTLEEQSFSLEKNVTLEEFIDVYSAFGVQLDDRLETLNVWTRTLDKGIKGIVNFTKDIPGFKQLHMQDQMSLIKSKYFLLLSELSHLMFMYNCNGFHFHLSV